MTCLLAVFIESHTPSFKESASLLVLTSGVMIAVWEGSIAGTPQAIITCMLGTLCNAATLSTAGRILSERVDVMRLTFYTAPVSAICLAPLSYTHEVRLGFAAIDMSSMPSPGMFYSSHIRYIIPAPGPIVLCNLAYMNCISNAMLQYWDSNGQHTLLVQSSRE